MASATITNSAQCLGKTFGDSRAIPSDGAVVSDPNVTAAKTGTLTTRTDNTVGTLTMSASHGITTASRISIFFADGTRANVLVGTVSVNSVPFTLGSGANLPLVSTAITAMMEQSEPFVVTAANLQALMVGAPVGSSAVFRGAADAVRLVVTAKATGSYVWDVLSGVATPFGGDVLTVGLAHADATSARQVNALALVN